jgi:4-hydroxy-tetrahydrodipicolinate synthase
MISASELEGCMVAVITPMVRVNGDLKIDTRKWQKVVQGVIDNDAAGIVIAGTTGQSATLTHEEQIRLVIEGSIYARGYAEGAGKKILIIAAAGSNATHEAVHLSRGILEAADIDALLHVTGYYNNPPQAGLVRHFQAIADLTARFDTPIVLYNVPSRTASNLESQTVIELSRHPYILGIKEASGNLEQIRKITDATNRDHFAVVSGEDHLVYDIMKMGGQGVISATANRWPREFQTLCNLCFSGEWERAEELQKALQPCVDATFCVKNPIPLHYMFDTEVRPPLVSVGELPEPMRSKSIDTIGKALAIESFPHVDGA